MLGVTQGLHPCAMRAVSMSKTSPMANALRVSVCSLHTTAMSLAPKATPAKTAQRVKTVQKRSRVRDFRMPEWNKTYEEMPPFEKTPTYKKPRPWNNVFAEPKSTLQRRIQLEIEQKLDQDGRIELVKPESPNYIIPGSAVLIEYLPNYQSNDARMICGILLHSAYRANVSSMLLRTQILGTFVEMNILILAPTIRKIHVLQMAPKPEGNISKPVIGLRDHPEEAIVEWKDLEKMASAFRSQARMDSGVLDLNLD